MRALLLLTVPSLLVALGSGRTLGQSGPVVKEVRAGSHEGALRLEIVASEPPTSLLIETSDPFTLTLFLAHTIFAFPPSAHEMNEGPLRKAVAVVLDRPEGLLARLDFVFDRRVDYRLQDEGRRLSLDLDAPGIPDRVLFGTAQVAASAGEPSPATPPEPRAPAPGAAAPLAPQVRQPSVPAAPVGPIATLPQSAAAPSARPPAVPISTPPRGPGDRPGPPEETGKSAPPPAARAARIHGLTPTEAGQETRVTVEADWALVYRAFTLNDPPRLVVDFDNVTHGLDRGVLPVGGRVLERIRSSQFAVSPIPVVRLVFDLKQLVPYRIEPQARGVVVHIEAAGSARTGP